MSIEQMILKIEQVCSVLEAVFTANSDFAPAIELSQETLLDVIEDMKPYIKLVDLK